MKPNKKQFNKIFKNMEVETAKVWRTTTSRVVHRDKKKQADKYACRKGVL
jgi:hypothetical protein